MSNRDQPDGTSSDRGGPESPSRGTELTGQESQGPIHEGATIPGGPDAQIIRRDDSSRRGSTGSIPDLAEFRRSLIEIGLIGEDELDALVAHVPASEGALGLARILQDTGKLTAYQAAAIYQRKSSGLRIGNYMILDKLSADGRGKFFKARLRRPGGVVALKILPPSFARDRTAVLRLKRVAESAGKLKHPNIVGILDVNEDRGVAFLVMQFVEGCDLERVVRDRGPLRVVDAIAYVIQAARGLAAAHAEGIIHHDIKPSNLLIDSAGIIRVLGLGSAAMVNSSIPSGQSARGRPTESEMDRGSIDFMAPELAEDPRQADHRADIYSLGCTMHFLLMGREPFGGETVPERPMDPQARPVPRLRAARPDVPAPLEDAIHRMMARRPADRPESMTAVIPLLETCLATAVEGFPTNAGIGPKSRPAVSAFDKQATKRTAPKSPGRDLSTLGRVEESEEPKKGSVLSLDDPAMDVDSVVAPPPLTAATSPGAVERWSVPSVPPFGYRTAPAGRPEWRAILYAIAASAVLGVVVIGWAIRSRLVRTNFRKPPAPTTAPAADRAGLDSPSGHEAVVSSAPAAPEVVRTIFDGKTGSGWMLTDGKPLPRQCVQPDGLNPHRTNSYLIVYKEKLGDFVLDFDYKLSKGGNSGVFLRVGDLKDPVHTGVEVALADTSGAGIGDTGAFYGLVPPRSNAQKPAGQWNHLTITAAGSILTVSLNGTEISRIDLDEWSVPGKRPDGTYHTFRNIAIARLPRSGYLGFQNLKGDCWFKEIKLKAARNPAIGTTESRSREG
jgi:serine/threonine protein kinase